MENKINWEELGFSYIKTPWRFTAKWQDGQWSHGALTGDNQLTISEASTALHYGQQCFAGLQASRGLCGAVSLFLPEQNNKK